MNIHRLHGEPSPWVVRFAPLLRAGSRVLDLACGGGRHATLLAAAGHHVDAVDRDSAALRALGGVPGIRLIEADLEAATWPLAGRRYDLVVVTNYLYRPAFDALLACVDDAGMLIYETFMHGNAAFGKPSNPDFLLAEDELLDRLRPAFRIVAFEQGEVARPKPAMVQRVCAVRDREGWPRIV